MGDGFLAAEARVEHQQPRLASVHAVVERQVAARPVKQTSTQDAPAFLNAYCLAKRTDEGTLSVAVRGTCKKVKFAIGKTWVTRQAQVHQVKFKITCSGY